MSNQINTVFDISIDFEKSKGSYLYDKKSKRYFLDFFQMFSSLPLGYNHEIFDKEFDEKVRHLTHLKMCNNLFHSEELETFYKALKEISPLPYLHFCSTGALAVESAIKCAYEQCKDPRKIVVGTKNGYHGINAWGFITDTGIPSVQNRVIHYPRNNWKNVSLELLPEFLKKNLNNLACCVIEPIQCTAGDLYLDPAILLEVQNICKENDICLIVDEVQTGLGVTGHYWYCEKIALEPDILVFGKKTQISGIMVNEKYSEAIKSSHRKLEVTFDGDLIDACRAEYILKAIAKYNLLDKVKENSSIFFNELSPLFLNYRSEGHLIAFDFESEKERDNFVDKAYRSDLLVNPTSKMSVRIRPNLALSKEETEDFLHRARKILN